MHFQIAYRFIPFRRAPETAPQYDADTGTAVYPDGTRWNIGELLAIARNDIPPDDMEVIKEIKNAFQGELMYINVKRPVPESERLKKQYQRWQYCVCKCSASVFSLVHIARIDAYLVRCARCGRNVGTMSAILAETMIGLHPNFKKENAKQLNIIESEIEK